jgi:hypothetical protein
MTDVVIGYTGLMVKNQFASIGKLNANEHFDNIKVPFVYYGWQFYWSPYCVSRRHNIWMIHKSVDVNRGLIQLMTHAWCSRPKKNKINTKAQGALFLIFNSNAKTF